MKWPDKQAEENPAPKIVKKQMMVMQLSRKAFIIIGITAIAASSAAALVSNQGSDRPGEGSDTKSQPKDASSPTFTFTAFGDAGWADTHIKRPRYSGGFEKAFLRFNSKQNTLGDINYINWETSVGTQCDQFWTKHTPSTFAFLTHPNELEDAIKLGFNVIGLANNHTFDCIRSKEGNGPIQSYRFIADFQKKNPNIAFSGVFAKASEEPTLKDIALKQGNVPVTFLSAYVGGNSSHCANMSCSINLSRAKAAFSDKRRLRILALHSWNKSSHQELKATLRHWVQSNLVDIAIGTGPHIAESIEIINTKNGKKILATSLGNFIHPSLSPQPYNAVLQTTWKINHSSKEPELIKVNAIKASCDGGSCLNTGTININ